MNKSTEADVYVLLGYNKDTKKAISSIYEKSQRITYVIDFIPHVVLSRVHHFIYCGINKTDFDDIIEKSLLEIIKRFSDEDHIIFVPCNKFFYDFVSRNREALECFCVIDTHYFLSERV